MSPFWMHFALADEERASKALEEFYEMIWREFFDNF
jgi:hypothetical protein